MKAHIFVAALGLLQGAGTIEKLLDMGGVAGNLSTPLWLMLYGWAAASLLLIHGSTWISWLLHRRLLLMIIAFLVACSVFWSENAFLTVQRLIHLLGSTLFGVYIGYHFPYRTLLNLLAWVLGFILVGSVVLAVVAPSYGLQEYRGEFVWGGLHGDKNNLGFSATIGFLFYVQRLFAADVRYRAVYVLLSIIALINLQLCHSATSVVALILSSGFAGVFLVASAMRMSVGVTLLLLVSSLACAGMVLGGAIPSWLVDVLSRSDDLTGRKEVWDKALSVIAEYPWTGTGYGTIWFPATGAELGQEQILHMYRWHPYHAHNGFIHVGAELGLPVLVVILLFMAQVFVEPVVRFSRRPSPLTLFMVAYQCAFVIDNLLEARLLIDRNLHWLLYVALPVALLRSLEPESLRTRDQSGQRPELMALPGGLTHYV